MTPEAREKHAELTLAAIVTEASSDRLTDAGFRAFVKSLTASLTLDDSRPGLAVIKGGRA